MILSVPKCIFLAVCIYVATADNMDPPSCSQIANNPMKCIWHRFKVQCAKECDPNNQNNQNQNNGNNGSPNNQNNGNNGNNAGGNSVTRVTTKPVTGHQGSSEEKSDSKGNKEAMKLGRKKSPKPKSGESTVTVRGQDSTVSAVTNKPISTGMTNSHTGFHHSHETGMTNKPVSTGMTNSPNGNHEDQNRQVVPAVHHSNEDHNDGDSNEDHTNKPSSHKFSTKHPFTPSTKSKSNKNCNKVDPCVDLAKANEGFKQRCQAAGIKDTCWEKCKYDVTFDELKKAMLGKQCPIDGMRTYLQCGANSQDNRQCCEKTGVLEGKRAFCYPFCNPNGADWPAQNQAMKYMPCAGQLNAIMRCHWAGLND